MFPGGSEPDFAKNIKAVDWLKADLLTSISVLYKSILRGNEDRLLDSLAGTIVSAYILARRLGFTYSKIDLEVESKLRQGVEDSHELEQWFGDLTMLLTYLVDRKR